MNVYQSLSCFRLFATPWTATYQASLSFTVSQSLFKFMSFESVMLSNHLILCHPLLLLPSIFPSIRVFSNESALHIRCKKCFLFKTVGDDSTPTMKNFQPKILIVTQPLMTKNEPFFPSPNSHCYLVLRTNTMRYGIPKPTFRKPNEEDTCESPTAIQTPWPIPNL